MLGAAFHHASGPPRQGLCLSDSQTPDVGDVLVLHAIEVSEQPVRRHMALPDCGVSDLAGLASLSKVAGLPEAEGPGDAFAVVLGGPSKQRED